MLSNCQNVILSLELIVLSQNPLTFMIPIYSTTVLYFIIKKVVALCYSHFKDIIQRKKFSQLITYM